MYIPSQEQWQKVIDTLKSVLPLATTAENFDMCYGIIYNECNTVCCVGGWYKVALTESKDLPKLHERDWTIGKEFIGHDLGFESGDAFKLWAADNPELWGNKDGYDMFMEECAYNAGVPGAEAKTLQDVINHYEFVKQQCYAYANQTTVANGN